MRTGRFARADVDEIVNAYAKGAAGHRRATEVGDHRAANKQHDIVAAAYRELTSRKAAAALTPLLRSDDPSVRSWAGAHALEFAPEEGEAVLEDLSESRGSWASPRR